MKLQYVLCVLCFSLLVTCEIAARIELSSEFYSSGDILFVHCEFQNNGDSLHLLPKNTPLEGEWNSRMFSIMDKFGNEPTYIGRIVKHAPAQESHFESLSSGQVRSITLELSAGYDFYTAGEYQVTLEVSTVTLDGEKIDLHSNTVTLTVLQADEKPLETQETRDNDVNFIGCSEDRISILYTDFETVKTMVENVLVYMDQDLPPACSLDYSEWFGRYSVRNWITIQNDYRSILQLFQSERFGVDCTCDDERYYAYVYPNDRTHTIYVCNPVFWEFASSEIYTEDSQPGTLIHEASHFENIAATDDNAYGTTLCRELAMDNPNLAVNNADSHEYFAEFQPTVRDDCNETPEPGPSLSNGVCGPLKRHQQNRHGVIHGTAHHRQQSPCN